MSEESPKKPTRSVEHHETYDVNARGVAWFAVGLVITISVIFVVVRGLSELFHEQQGMANTHDGRPQTLPPEPRLQSNPARDLARIRQWENSVLNSYGWVDRQEGVVRIPIERAMDLITRRGLPAPRFSSGKTPLQIRRERASTEERKP